MLAYDAVLAALAAAVKLATGAASTAEAVRCSEPVKTTPRRRRTSRRVYLGPGGGWSRRRAAGCA